MQHLCKTLLTLDRSGGGLASTSVMTYGEEVQLWVLIVSLEKQICSCLFKLTYTFHQFCLEAEEVSQSSKHPSPVKWAPFLPPTEVCDDHEIGRIWTHLDAFGEDDDEVH